ncbi:MAG: hypothetical protein R3F30_04655 [Planctomycetota bacterium]
MVERSLGRTTLRSVHLCLTSPPGRPLADAARALFAELAGSLSARGVAPFQEKVWAPLPAMAELEAIRAEVFAGAGLDPGTPVTWLSGRADEALGVVGLQCWGLAGDDGVAPPVRTVHHAGVAGRLCETPEGRLLHLAAVSGAPARSEVGGGLEAEAGRMFARAEAALRAQGMGFDRVVRTWIHLERLLDWYGAFNKVRTQFLAERGITGGDEAPYPASTGIQGTAGFGDCVMDLCAVEGFEARPIHATSRQKRPLAYGSSFSRGTTLDLGGERHVLVSGTASIDGAGRTLHTASREAQVLETLLSVAALLDDQGAGLADLVQGTLFCKDRETLQVHERLVRQLGLPRLPLVPVLADVCRPELFVEVEAVANVPAGRPEEEA